MNNKDLFEEVRNILGLEYISDIRFEPNVKRAIATLKQIDLKEYPLSVLSDMANYIKGYDKPFDNYQSAVAFFANA